MSPNGCGRQVGTNINQHQLLECRSACCWCAKLLDHLPTGYLPPVAGSQCCTFTWGPLRKNVGGNRNPMLCDHVTQETCNFWSVPQIKKPNAMKYRRKGVQFTPFWMRAAICEIVSKYGASWRIMAHL